VTSTTSPIKNLQGFVGHVANGLLQLGLALYPGLGQARGHQLCQFIGDFFAGTGFAGQEVVLQGLGLLEGGRQVQPQRPAFLPVA
jgi:hypothetical protein